jgi:hypothetical protein
MGIGVLENWEERENRKQGNRKQEERELGNW